jgi:glycosyltransferase involved in cell wall biosynthesis
VRILTLHNTYQRAGGEDRAQMDITGLLRERGHDVVELREDNHRIKQLGAGRTALRTIWSQESYARVRDVLRGTHFDVLDVHNTFPLLSPSVYYAARAAQVPVVQTVHNYRLICARATLYRDGHPCEDCLHQRSALPAVLHKCYRDSRSASACVAAMLGVHGVLRTWSRLIDVFVALSDAQRQKLVDGGLPAERVVVKPHFLSVDPGVGRHQGRFVLYVGRLEPEKGVRTLLEAWQRVSADGWSLRIIGDGSLASVVARAAETQPSIEWLGQRSADDVGRAMGDAALLVVPSEWQEPFGLVVIEAFARGTPVLAAAAGGLPELVVDGQHGLVVPAADAPQLAAALEWAMQHPDALITFGRRARESFDRRYTADANYATLLAVFERAIGRRREQVAA